MNACLLLRACLQKGERRLKGKELSFPVVVGTIAFYLGKKVGQRSVPGQRCRRQELGGENARQRNLHFQERNRLP